MRNPLSLLKGAHSIFRENVTLFVGILFVPMLLSVIVGIFKPPAATGVINLTDWSMYLVMLLIAVAFNVLMAIALIFAVDNRSLTVGTAYKQAFSMFVSYSILSLLVSLIIMVGFMLFIIPGIIVSIWLAFASFVLVLEGTKIIAAMKQSREYVRGKWWGVFYRLIMVTLFVFIVYVIASLISKIISVAVVSSIIELLINIIITPIVVAYMYLLYQDVKGSPSVSAVAEMTPPTPSGPTVVTS